MLEGQRKSWRRRQRISKGIRVVPLRLSIHEMHVLNVFVFTRPYRPDLRTFRRPGVGVGG